MDSRTDIDTDRVDEVVLALLWLNLSATGAVWKGFDWIAMERLHACGLISDPVGKARSIEMTPTMRGMLLFSPEMPGARMSPVLLWSR